MGHVALKLSHSSIHSMWKQCWHLGMVFRVALGWYSDKHIGQVLSLGLGKLQAPAFTKNNNFGQWSTCGIEFWDFKASSSIIGLDLANEKIRNFNPNFFDFGLARLCAKGQCVVSMTTTRGTICYIAPEVFSRNFGKVSYKSDIYSFRILLLEMVGGRKNVDANGETTGQIYFP